MPRRFDSQDTRVRTHHEVKDKAPGLHRIRHLGLGKTLGLDLGMLMEVFSQTGANSRVLETDGEDMVNRDHECYFSCAHAAKDSGIAIELAQKAGLNLPLAEATKSQYDRMVAANLGELDKSGVAELTFPGRLSNA